MPTEQTTERTPTDGGESLRRELTTATLTLNGVGVMVGAGIFVLVGKVVGEAGHAAWLSFVGAAVAALPTALAYGELASRYPRSAGEAVFAERAFGQPSLSFVVGFLVVASGLMSTAAVSVGFAKYLQVATGPLLPDAIVIALFLAVLSIVNARGIRESTWLNVGLTTISVIALLALSWAGLSSSTGPGLTMPSELDLQPAALLAGSALAFYAFIGFEDICNVAEETRNPSRTIPRAVLASLAITTVLYVLVVVTATSVAPSAELAAHDAPLSLLSSRIFPDLSQRWIAVVAILAVSNTALFNLIMASRVMYGMARSGWLPASLGHVSGRRKTPQRAVLLAFVLVLVFAVTGMLGVLAQATNVLILLAFVAVNASLIAVRARRIEPDADAGPVFRVPLVVPIVGVAFDLVLLANLPAGAYVRAAMLAAVGGVLHLAVRSRPSSGPETTQRG